VVGRNLASSPPDRGASDEASAGHLEATAGPVITPSRSTRQVVLGLEPPEEASGRGNPAEGPFPVPPVRRRGPRTGPWASPFPRSQGEGGRRPPRAVEPLPDLLRGRARGPRARALSDAGGDGG